MKKAAACVLLFAVAGAAGAQSAPSENYFSPPSNTSSFQFNWDALLRYDAIDLSRQSRAPNIYRWRSEFRPELDWKASDRFRVGVRLIGELSSDSNAGNALRLDNYRSNNAAVDRAFVEAQPGNFTLTAGQFGMPFEATEMLWDPNIQVPGAAVSWRAPFSSGSSFTLASGFFYGPQREHDQSHIAVGQAVLALGDADAVRFDWAESFWRFTHLANTARFFVRQNVARGLPPGTASAYASDFRILDSLLRLRIPLGRFPLTLAFDWIHNFGASVPANADGYEAVVRAGRAGDPGDVEFFNVFENVGQDAVVGAYNTDEWWFHSWADGDRAGFSVTVAPEVEVRPSVVFQRRQDRTRSLRRYLVDLVKDF